MRRYVLIILVLLGLSFAGATRSHADSTVAGGYCFSGPFNTLVDCSTPTAGIGTATARPAATPDKELIVSGATPGPYHTASYDVRLVSQLSCFSLDEPTNLYTLGSPGSAEVSELYPVAGVSSVNGAITVRVDQHVGTQRSGTAQLSLEVNTSTLGPEGLVLKAVWPQEQIERLALLVAPASPTPTATSVPGASTATPVPPTSTSTPTATPGGTPSPTPTPVPQAFSARACVQPSILSGQTLGGDATTIRGLTTPGATCTGAVEYLDGSLPAAFSGDGQLADNQGLVAFPLSEKSTSGGGVAQVRCSLNGQTQTACTGFLILQSGDSALTASDQQTLLDQIQGIVADPRTCTTLFS